MSILLQLMWLRLLWSWWSWWSWLSLGRPRCHTPSLPLYHSLWAALNSDGSLVYNVCNLRTVCSHMPGMWRNWNRLILVFLKYCTLCAWTSVPASPHACVVKVLTQCHVTSPSLHGTMHLSTISWLDHDSAMSRPAKFEMNIQDLLAFLSQLP